MTDPTIVDPDAYRRKVFAWARSQGLGQLRIGVYQPKVNGASEWVCSMAELETFAEQLLLSARAVAAAEADAAIGMDEDWRANYLNPNPNEEECAFCRAMPTCPAQQAKLQREAGVDFGVIEEATPVPVPTSQIDLNRAMGVVGQMEDWCKAVRAECERQLLAGGALPDWGLELGRQGNREWSDAQEAERILRKQMRLPMEDVYSFKLKSPTQIEKLTAPVKSEDGTPDKPTLGPNQWKTMMPLIQRAPPKPSVKPKSAIKVAYNPQPAADGFGAVNED